MNEAKTCHYEGCYQLITGMCQGCKHNFCSKHLKEGSFQTADGKLQYGKYCIDCFPHFKKTGNYSNPAHPFRPLFYIAAIIIIIIVAIIEYT